MFVAAIGVKVHVVRRLCGNLDKVDELSVIIQSHIGHYFSKDTELYHNCKFSRAAFQDELVQLNKINRIVYVFETGDTEKIHILNDSFRSLIKYTNNSHSPISIL